MFFFTCAENVKYQYILYTELVFYCIVILFSCCEYVIIIVIQIFIKIVYSLHK